MYGKVGSDKLDNNIVLAYVLLILYKVQKSCEL